jgi:hypothetical protein
MDFIESDENNSLQALGCSDKLIWRERFVPLVKLFSPTAKERHYQAKLYDVSVTSIIT